MNTHLQRHDQMVPLRGMCGWGAAARHVRMGCRCAACADGVPLRGISGWWLEVAESDGSPGGPGRGDLGCGDAVGAGHLLGVEGVSGAQERFRGLFAEHYVSILNYARRRVVEDAASDVVEEVFIVVWRRLSELPSDPLPWLYGVARRVVANQRRGADRALRLSNRLIVAASVGELDRSFHADPAEAVTESMVFAAAFDRLSDDDKEILSLVVWEGLGARDAATVLGCSVSAVTMRLTRARRRLRTHLNNEGEER
jgi:RNA polymerase sigma factor (sigma-70 family)